MRCKTKMETVLYNYHFKLETTNISQLKEKRCVTTESEILSGQCKHFMNEKSPKLHYLQIAHHHHHHQQQQHHYNKKGNISVTA